MNKIQPRLPKKGKVRKQRGLIYQQMWRELHKWERLYARRVHQGKEKRSREYNRESGMVPGRSWYFSYTLKIGWDFEGLGKKREKEGHSGRENSMSRQWERKMGSRITKVFSSRSSSVQVEPQGTSFKSGCLKWFPQKNCEWSPAGEKAFVH